MNISSEKPNILFVGAFSDPKDGSGGGQRYACKTLLDSEISEKVNFYTIDSTMETLPPPGILRRLVLALKRFLKFCLLLMRFNFQSTLIFTSSGLSFIEKGLMIIVAKFLGLRAILCPRSGLILDDIEKSSMFLKYLKFVFRRCDYVLCQSESWKDFYKNITKLDDSKFTVIKNWIKTDSYIKIPLVRTKKAKINALYMGWLERNKGIYELINAVGNSQTLQKEFKFMICGKGSESANIVKLIKDKRLEDCFDFYGWVAGKKKLNILSNADILIMPSYREGLPNSLLEGMASGCSVIASSVGAIPEVISSKQNGLLIDNPREDLIVESLLYFYSPQRRYECGMNARKTIIDEHDINQKWKSIYEVISG